MRLRVLPILMAALVVAVPLVAGAGSSSVEAARSERRPIVQRSPDLWATINVCDTALHPNTIGIRGSMPGLGRRRGTELWMRFRVQYLAKDDGKWHDVAQNADSKWKELGRVRTRVLEAGQNFEFLAPPDGGRHRLRGVVMFRWVRGGEILERARKVTEAGHRSTAGADPEGYSAAVCDVLAP